MANSVDPDQTAPIGAVCSGSMLFAYILKLVSNVRQLFAADFSKQHFQMHFFLGALRVKGQVHVFAGRVKIVSHSSCRTSAIFLSPARLPAPEACGTYKLLLRLLVKVLTSLYICAALVDLLLPTHP